MDNGKRQQTVADRFLTQHVPSHLQPYQDKTIDQLKRSVRAAHRFLLDDDASDRLADVIYEVPDLLAREQHFARAPFDITWIELTAMSFFDRLEFLHHRDDKAFHLTGDRGTTDNRLAFLIDHNRLMSFACGTRDEPNSHCYPTTLVYQLHTEWPIEDQLEFSARTMISRMQIGMLMWGSTWDRIDKDARRALRDNTMVEFLPTKQTPSPYNMTQVLQGGVGDLRTAIALLLMLNRPSITRYRQVDRGRGFVRGKLKPFLSHSTVNISFDAAQVLSLIGTPAGDGVPRRRHEVRGHFCHDKTAREYMRIAGCIHEWVATDREWTPWPDAKEDEADNWICSSCGGKRWWRHEHHRGDGQIGFVVHDGYDVTP